MTFEDMRLLATPNEPVQQEQDNSGESVETNYGNTLADLLGSASCDNEFTPEQIRVIKDKVITAVGYAADHIDYCNYLSSKYNMMNVYDTKENRITLCDGTGGEYPLLVTYVENDGLKVEGPDGR